MSDSGSVDMQDVQKDMDNNSPFRSRKLRPYVRRLSKRKVYRQKRMSLTLQKKNQESAKKADNTAVGQLPEEVAEERMVEEPSTSDGRNHTQQEIMYAIQ